MRVAFAGTPEFAQTALAAILAAGFEIPLVLTQPDRPAGRGQKLQPSPVKALALQHGLTVYQPERLKDPASHQPLIDSSIDVMVVAAYGLILPQAVLDIPKLGCINIHASLLPRWRGAAPIQRAIEAGDPETGVTIMRVTAGLDAGPMLLAEATPITGQDNARTVHDRLANLGAQLVVRALRGLPALIPREQPDAGVTYARKIEKGEAHLDLREPAALLARRIRAFDPFPGACVTLEGTTIKFWHATAEADRGPVGQIPTGQILAADSQGVLVACGEGALRITELQKPGGKRLPSADFLRGFPLAVGQQFALP